MANSLDQVLNRVKQILTPVASNAMTAAKSVANQSFEGYRSGYNKFQYGLNNPSPQAQQFVNTWSPKVQQFEQSFMRSPAGIPGQMVKGYAGSISQNTTRAGQGFNQAYTQKSAKPLLGATWNTAKAVAQVSPTSLIKTAPALLAGGIGAGANALQGKNIAQGFGAGTAEGMSLRPLLSVTNPLTNTVLGKVAPSSFAVKQIAQRGVAGLANLGEDEIIAKLEGSSRNKIDRATSIAIGAVMVGNTELLGKLKSPEAKKAAEQAVESYRGTLARKITWEDAAGNPKQVITDKQEAGDWIKHLEDQGLKWNLELTNSSPGFVKFFNDPDTGTVAKFEAPAQRGDITKLQKNLDEILGTDTYINSGKWQARLPARETARRSIEAFADQGDESAQRVMKQVERIENEIADLQIARQNKIPVKRDLTQQVAENVTGKRMRVKPSPKVEAPPIAPMAEPEVVKSNNRAREAGVPSRETVKASLPQRLDNFIQETLDYTTQAPTGGMREAGTYTKVLRTGQAKVTSAVEKGLGAENPLIRNAASTMQNFFRGLGMSPERAAQSAEMRGGMAVAVQRGSDVAGSLYATLGKDLKTIDTSRTRIKAVLDPEISKIKVKLSDLTPDELAVHNLIRKGLDYVHDTNYAYGFLTEKTYKKNLGTYTPRKYTTFEMPEEINQFAKQTKKMNLNAYKARKELDAWMIENSLNDPIYALATALTQTETNVTIKKYTDYLASQPNLITDVPRPGFTKLSDSPAYGALSGKYVLNSAAEDLKGFFYANDSLQKVYEVFRAWDRMLPRQLQKKLLTVFNPTTNVGNIVSDNIFGPMVGANPLSLNKKILSYKQNKPRLKQLSDYMMRRGIVGTDITRTDIVSKFSSIDSVTKSVEKPQSKIKTIGNKVQGFYGGVDDIYKVAALDVLLDKGYSLEEATRRVADGFQNYATAGKFYDTWAKTPIIGSPFIKFQGDLIRIIKSTATNNPLGLIAFLGTLSAVAHLSSKASGETEEDYETRTKRFAAPMIPGLNIPLTWQTPIGEINVARYISPFYANNETTSVAKMIPFVPNIDTQKDVATNIALNANDPLTSPIVQTLVNRDFRGKPISDPNEKKWSPSTLTGGEKLTNQVKFVGRAYTPPPVNSVIDVGSALQGKPNMYGSTQTPGQALARVGGVKISQFGPEQAQAQRVNDAYYDQKQLESNMDLEKAITKDLLSGKIDQKTADKRIANIYKDSGSATNVLGEGITQLQNGSYATLIDGKLKEYDTPEEAQKGIQKYEFKQSGKNIEIIGDTVWRLSKDGDATSEPKIDYDTKMTTQKMENAKLGEDYKAWQDLAFTQLQNFQTQMQDPTLDELEKVELQQKIDKLITDAVKYNGYGGFEKPKKAKKPPEVKKMQVAKFSKPSFKMKRDSGTKKNKIKVVSSKSIAPPKVNVSRFKVKKA